MENSYPKLNWDFPQGLHLVFVEDRPAAKRFLAALGLPDLEMREEENIAFLHRGGTYSYYCDRNNKSFYTGNYDLWKKAALDADARVFFITNKARGVFEKWFPDFYSVSTYGGQLNVLGIDKNPELPIGTFSLGPKPKKRPRQCPWCKQKGQSWQGEDGFWYVGCNGGFCPVSPRTSGQETEEQAIEIWNSWK